jgi:hypothetical protein
VVGTGGEVGAGVGATVGAGVGAGAVTVPATSTRSAFTTKPVDAAFLRPVTRTRTVCVPFASEGVVNNRTWSARLAP